MIPEVIGEDFPDDLEGLTLVVADQIFDILQQESFGPMNLKDALDVEEQCALGRTIEAMRLIERILL